MAYDAPIRSTRSMERSNNTKKQWRITLSNRDKVVVVGDMKWEKLPNGFVTVTDDDTLNFKAMASSVVCVESVQ